MLLCFTSISNFFISFLHTSVNCQKLPLWGVLHISNKHNKGLQKDTVSGQYPALTLEITPFRPEIYVCMNANAPFLFPSFTENLKARNLVFFSKNFASNQSLENLYTHTRSLSFEPLTELTEKVTLPSSVSSKFTCYKLSAAFPVKNAHRVVFKGTESLNMYVPLIRYVQKWFKKKTTAASWVSSVSEEGNGRPPSQCILYLENPAHSHHVGIDLTACN